MNKSKKIISILAAATLSFSAMSLAACGKQDYKGDSSINAGYASGAEVKSNGGFVVEKGDYVYFINGQESNSADNTYGDVVKGALMRISKSELAAGDYANAKTVVPSLFVTGTYDAGIYIYGDYVYYATPTSDKDESGNVANTYLDFKRAKIDGTEAPDSYFFRLSSNSTKYRFVKEGDTVYCLYEEDSQLKSYNTSTKKTTVLVKGAGTIYYDTQDLTNPNVYYTMSVSLGLDEENTTSQSYNQIYTVNAAASATVATVDGKVTYSAKDASGAEVAKYQFKESYLKAENEAAKENKEDEPYNLSDYTTLPYVNLGKLVLDGIGSTSEVPSHFANLDKSYNESVSSLFGYTYTIQSYTNDGLYFTRKDAQLSDDNTNLYYVAESVSGNGVANNESVDTVSDDTTKASATAIYEAPQEGKHSYFYTADNNIYYVKDGEELKIAKNVSGATLWKVDGDYLYYYGTGTNGKNMSRVNYTGEKEDYAFYANDDEYATITLPLVDFNDSWYKPEFVEVAEGKKVVLYSNAQSFGAGSVAYNYIYAAKLGTNEEIKAWNEEIDAVNEYIDEYSENSELQNLMKYYFRTGSTAIYDTLEAEDEDIYSDYQDEEFANFIKEFAEGGKFAGYLESKYISLVGKVNEDNQEAIDTAWESYLKQLDEEETDDEGLPTWAIVLICVGGALVVAAAVLVPVLVVKKKKADKAKAEAIVNAYKRKKIDTTDDKSIDVYEVEGGETTSEADGE